MRHTREERKKNGEERKKNGDRQGIRRYLAVDISIHDSRLLKWVKKAG